MSLFALVGVAAAGVAPGFGYAAAPLGYAHAAPQLAYAHGPAIAKVHHAAPLAYAAPIAKAIVAQPEPYDPHPQYNYGMCKIAQFPSEKL